MTEENFETLNEVLKGEHMAIEGYETAMAAIEDKKIIMALEEINKQHKKHALEITDRIVQIGGRPEGGTGLAGIMSGAMLKARGAFQTDRELLEELYQGESLGIKSVKKVIREELDTTSLNMMKKILKTDESHLERLFKLINSHN